MNRGYNNSRDSKYQGQTMTEEYKEITIEDQKWNISPLDPSYLPVFRRYVTVSREITTGAKRILKTDCYNEGYRDRIADGNTVLLEYKREHIDMALSLHPELNIVQGDIRELPFRRQEFDLIIDLSTIDHIPPKDIPQVVNEYDRVLKPGGKILLVAWFSEVAGASDEWNPDMQFYFRYGKTKDLLEKHFAIDRETKLLSRTEPIETPYVPGVNLRRAFTDPIAYFKKRWREFVGYEYCYLVEFVMSKK